MQRNTRRRGRRHVATHTTRWFSAATALFLTLIMVICGELRARRTAIPSVRFSCLQCRCSERPSESRSTMRTPRPPRARRSWSTPAPPYSPATGVVNQQQKIDKGSSVTSTQTKSANLSVVAATQAKTAPAGPKVPRAKTSKTPYPRGGPAFPWNCSARRLHRRRRARSASPTGAGAVCAAAAASGSRSTL